MSINDAGDNIKSTSTSRAVSSASHVAAPALHHQDSNLQEALERAQAKIRALSEELEDQKSILSNDDKSSFVSTASSETALQRRQPIGLSVSQTAVLVLLAFLVGWFFF